MSELLPGSFRQYERYSEPDAERTISNRLDLFWEPGLQDWDIINSHPRHLPALVGLLMEPAISDDERFSLMCLAIASYDPLIPNNENHILWNSLYRELLRCPELYLSAVWYWAQPVVLSRKPFPISGKMAQIWNEINDSFIPRVSLKNARKIG